MPSSAVLVTRPAHQARPLCQALEAAGLQVIRLPVIEIEACDPVADFDLQAIDWLIFTSPNAVHHGLARLHKRPAACRIAAVGAATAKALEDAGVDDILSPPSDYSSEGLLKLTAFQALSGKQLVLVKGQAGRPLIADEMRARGAQLFEYAVYQRQLLSPDAAHVAQAISAAQTAIVTSGEILQRLQALTPASSVAGLHRLQLVVPSERVVQMAQSMGFSQVCAVPAPLTVSALVQAVLNPQITLPRRDNT